MKIAIASTLDSFDRIARTQEILRHFAASERSCLVVGAGPDFLALEQIYPQHSFVSSIDPDDAPTSTDGSSETSRRLFGRLRQFSPQAVLLDGTSPIESVAESLGIPIISIDPHFLFQFGHLDIMIPPTQFQELMSLKEQIRERLSPAQSYLIPNWFEPSFRSSQVILTQPLLRQDLTAEPPSSGGILLAFAAPHILPDIPVFSTVEQPVQVFVSVDKQRQQKERVLWEREIKGTEGTMVRRRKQQLPQNLDTTELLSQLPDSTPHISYQLAQHELWVKAMPSCKAVLSDGHPMIIAEALFLQKPILVIPKHHDFASWGYAQYVEHLGFGESHSKLTRAVLEGFLLRLDRYREQIQKYQPTSPPFFTALEQLLTRLAKKRSRAASSSRNTNPPRHSSFPRWDRPPSTDQRPSTETLHNEASSESSEPTESPGSEVPSHPPRRQAPREQSRSGQKQHAARESRTRRSNSHNESRRDPRDKPRRKPSS